MWTWCGCASGLLWGDVEGRSRVHGYPARVVEFSQDVALVGGGNRMFSTVNPQLWVGDAYSWKGTRLIDQMWNKLSTYTQGYTQLRSTIVD